MARFWIILLLSIIGMEFFSSPAGSAPRVKWWRGSTILKPLSHADIVATERAFEIVSVAMERIPQPGESFSREAILDGLTEQASQVALEQVKKDPKKWSFEVLSGKLTTNASVTVGSGEVKLGEANIYAIIGLVGAPILGCAALEQMHRVGCIKRLFTKVFDPEETDLPGLPIDVPRRERPPEE